MLILKILFNVVAFSLFIIIFFKMLKKNDTNYVVILCLQAIGIAINFIEIIFSLKYGAILTTIMYMLAIVIPLIVIILEHRKINFSELMYVALSKFFIIIKNNKQAKKFLIDLVTKYPESYIGHKMLAEIYEKEGGMRKAIDEYVHVIDINKTDYDSYYKISNLLNDLDQKEQAAEMLETLLKKQPNYLKATQLLGDIYCEQERYKEAVNIYMDALKYNPADYDIYYNLGIVYTMLNDFKSAKDCYEKAAEINTLLYNAYYNLGEINFIYNDLDEAEKYFLQSTKGEQVEARAYYNLAKIYMIKGEKDNAIKFVNAAIDTDSTYYKKADSEPIFIPIKAYLNYPSEDSKIPEYSFTKKEAKLLEHLERTTKLVGKINLGSLGIQKNKEKQQEKERE